MTDIFSSNIWKLNIHPKIVKYHNKVKTMMYKQKIFYPYHNLLSHLVAETPMLSSSSFDITCEWRLFSSTPNRPMDITFTNAAGSLLPPNIRFAPPLTDIRQIYYGEKEKFSVYPLQWQQSSLYVNACIQQIKNFWRAHGVS